MHGLGERQPPIVVSHGAAREFVKRRMKPADAITISIKEELQEKYGSLVKSLVVENATAYKLCQALRSQAPPILCTDGIAKGWFKKYGVTLRCIDTVGHLELHCGSRIRENDKTSLEAPQLRVWLQTELLVDASVSTCQKWRTKDWSTSGKLLSIDAVEEATGDRLRFVQYKDNFFADGSCTMVEVLMESSPPVVVDALLLRQWYAKYHPDSGPLSTPSAVELEQYLGNDLSLIHI